MKQTPTTKAHDYLTHGKVAVLVMTGTRARLAVEGHQQYLVDFNENSGWHCSCPATIDDCAHVIAAKLIVPLKVTQKPHLGTGETVEKLFSTLLEMEK